MPMMSFGLDLPKFWKRCINVEPSPAGSASNVTAGAVPSKMLEDVAVKCAEASVMGVPPVPAMTLRFAPTVAVMLTLRVPVGFGLSIRLLSGVLAIVDAVTWPLPLTSFNLSVTDPLKWITEPGENVASRRLTPILLPSMSEPATSTLRPAVTLVATGTKKTVVVAFTQPKSTSPPKWPVI